MRTRTPNSLLSLSRTALLFLGLAALGMQEAQAVQEDAGTNTYKFTNKETEAATDLHIEFSHEVEWDTTDATFGWQSPAVSFKNTSGSGSKKIVLKNGVGGVGVAKGDHLILTLGFPGKHTPYVKRWWWTKDEVSEKKLGNTKSGSKRKANFEYALFPGTAAGDGIIQVDGGGQTLIFQTSAGETAAQTAARFESEILGALSHASTRQLPPAHTAFQGTSFGDPALAGQMTLISPDSNGSISVTNVVEPVIYCTAGISAIGCQALIDATGFPSATATSGFSLEVTGVEGNKDGLFFGGTSGQQANSWGSGTSFMCIVPPVSRTPLLSASGNPGQCDGSFALDINALWCPSCPAPSKNPGAGATFQAQFWYRDPFNTSNQTTGLSNAIEFVLCP